MHGLKGGRWGGDHDLDRDGRETFGPALDVKETGVLSQRPTSHGFRIRRKRSLPWSVSVWSYYPR